MNVLRTKAHTMRALSLAVVLLFVTACNSASTPLVATIDTPTASTPLQVGMSVNITGKASGSGIASVDVWVDGAKLATVSAPAQNNEFAVAVPWVTDKSGAHVIQLKGMNDKGEVLITSDAMFITVKAPEPTATATLPPVTPTVAPTAASVVATTQVTVTVAPQGATASVKDGNEFVNVRKGPAVGYDKLGTLDKGQSAPVRGKNADGTWWQITFAAASDGVGWVIADLVSVTGDTTNLPVATAPALPTSAPQPTSVPATVVVVPLSTATSSAPSSVLLPYSQKMYFTPRDNIGDVPLGYNGEGKSTTLVWEVNGAKSLELEITAAAGSGIFQNCPVGNLASISPNTAVGKRMPLAVPSGSYQLSIPDKGYYIATIHVVKADGTSTFIPRNIIVDCYKTQ
jgi:uncharacterized protein YraI